MKFAPLLSLLASNLLEVGSFIFMWSVGYFLLLIVFRKWQNVFDFFLLLLPSVCSLNVHKNCRESLIPCVKVTTNNLTFYRPSVYWGFFRKHSLKKEFTTTYKKKKKSHLPVTLQMTENDVVPTPGLEWCHKLTPRRRKKMKC